MNSENSNISKTRRILLNLEHKINLKRRGKCVALSNRIMYYTWKNIKKLYKSNTCKVSPPIWNEKFNLTDGSYSLSDIRDYFEYFLKNTEKRLIILQLEYMLIE